MFLSALSHDSPSEFFRLSSVPTKKTQLSYENNKRKCNSSVETCYNPEKMKGNRFYLPNYKNEVMPQSCYCSPELDGRSMAT